MSIDTQSRVIVRTIAALEKGIAYILHQGGTSSGKTFGILYALLFFSLKYLVKGDIVSVVSQTLPHLKTGAIRDFSKILAMTEMEGKVIENKSDHTFILPNGVKFEFFAPDDEEKAKSGKRTILFINEANSVLYSIARQLMLRTTGPKILDWNPSGQFWLHRKLLKALKSHEFLFTRTTYRDNKSINSEIINEIERLRIIDPTQYDIYGLGIEGKGTEIIFPFYEIVDSFPDTDRVGAACDFGYTNHPSAGLRCCYYDGALYFQELFYEKGLSNQKIAELFLLQTRPYGQIIADSAEPKSIAELNSLGLDVKPALKGPDSIKFGIDQIKQYPIRITKESQNLLDEIDAYKWIMVDGVPTNKPKAGNDHLMDAMRYGIQSIITREIPLTAKVQKAANMGFSNFGV